ncbi:voltage-gated chloride channel family protein [Cyclobacterium xiamenense]|uniref:voltage-gated chloride channel family protein n=1 Tax=Cyclobacterium xiamenense TaxID=1297121 RepID=UPI0035CFE166
MLKRNIPLLALKKFLFRELLPSLQFTGRWLLLAAGVGLLVGTASAFFLESLDWVTRYRETHRWIIGLLPLGGFFIGWMYHKYGAAVVKGNNQLLEEFYNPLRVIPLRMAPLVLAGTLLTHFFGGSAGREGTAVQMGGAIADQFTKRFKLPVSDRKIILTVGVAAGFSSVFGTPLAGAIFALEWLVIGRLRYESIVPAFFAAYLAHYACSGLWEVHHTAYFIPTVPEADVRSFLWVIPAGICFGLAGRLFAKVTHFWTRLFSNHIAYPPLRPAIGGLVIALLVYLMGTTKYIGLGIPTIVDAFSESLPSYDFLVKLMKTAITLGSGFKGGEVTPLFYIGATLGNALSMAIPLPVALLAGMGFVGVFSGATNTPLACTLMGIELFGAESGLFIGLTCVIAYLFSGHSSIYRAQVIGSPKQQRSARHKGKRVG